MSVLSARQLSLGYGGRPIVHSVTTTLPPGLVTSIVGGNGCGKSTLLKGFARILRPLGGQVLLDDRPIADLPTREVAKVVGLLPQSPTCPDGVSVVDLVSRGRSPHRGRLRGWSGEDADAVARALHLTGTTGLAHRPVAELSGGQRQRVWIAMVLAQETELVLLDEPTTYLDLAHQVEILELMRDLNRQAGRTIVMVLHELNLAARYSDHVIAMRDGALIASGSPGEVLTADSVWTIFDLAATVIPDPVHGTPMVVPLGRPPRPGERDDSAAAQRTVTR